MLRIAERITCCCILKTNAGSDITCITGIDILSVVRMHLEDTSHSFAVVLCCIEDSCTCIYLTGVNTEVAELTNERVSSDLECESCERLIVRGRSFLFLTCFRVYALDVRDIERRRHIVNDSVEELLYALISVRSTANNRNHCICDSTLTDTFLDLINGNFLTAEVFFHDLIILLSNSLEHSFVVFLSLFNHIGRDIFNSDILSEVVIVNVSLHFNKVNKSLEVVFSADRELDRNSITLKTVVHHIYNVVEVCTHDIHLVYIYHSRYLIFICLSPNCFCLGLNAALCTENRYRTVEYTK